VRAIAAGEAIFGPGIATRVLSQLHGSRVTAEAPFPELTAREREILDLLAASNTIAAIAHRLGLSPKTVSNNVTNILTKLQVGDRAQAAILARDAGLGRDRPRPTDER
jgi:DNA-binding NarL/FixJ family response regulator